MRYRIEPVEWEVVYPVHVDPIGRMRPRAGRYEAKLAEGHLGAFSTGDAAAEAVWARLLKQSATWHASPPRSCTAG